MKQNHNKFMGSYDLKPYAKFQNPRPTPSGRKETGPERRKNAIKIGQYFPSAKPKGRDALLSDQI